MNNTTYGRKEIRSSMRKKNKVILIKFAAFVLAVLLIGFTCGILVGRANPKVIEVPVEVPKTTTLQDNVNQFGAIDDRIFGCEMSMDWGADDAQYLGFIPLDVNMDEDLQEFTFMLCQGYNIDWTLVMAIIQHESSFRPDVISKTNDYGLMQINKCNHEWLTETLGVTDFLDPYQNIRCGCFVIRKLFEEYTEPNMVLMSYNMGEYSASRLWEKGIYSTAYTEEILKIQEDFNKYLEGKEGTTNE